MHHPGWLGLLLAALIGAAPQALAATSDPGPTLPTDLVDFVLLEDASLEPFKVYTVTGTFTIAFGATLTIPNGAQLRFNPGAGLDIDGEVETPSSGAPITLTSNNLTPVPGDWRGVRVHPDAFVFLSLLRIEYADVGIEAEGSLLMLDCEIAEFTSTAIRFPDLGFHRRFVGADITRTRIANTVPGGTGIDVGPDVSIRIDNGSISGTERAIAVDAEAWITRMTLEGNKLGVTVGTRGELRIEGSTLRDNETGIRFDEFTRARGTIIHNSFERNRIALALNGPIRAQPEFLDARDNHWGTTDPLEISASILDSVENPELPTVEFIPFLASPGGARVPDDPGFLLGRLAAGRTIPTGTRVALLGRTVVPPGRTLTIEPGVAIFSQPNAYVRSAGALRVAGTETQPVIFRSAAAQPMAGDWRGLMLEGEGSDISHARVQHTIVGIDVTAPSARIMHTELQAFVSGINLRNGTQTHVEGVRLEDFTCNVGIQIIDSSPVLAGNRIRVCDIAVLVAGHSAPQIIGINTIERNDVGIEIRGTRMRGGNPRPIIRGNNLDASSFGVSVSFVDLAPEDLLEPFDLRDNYWRATDVRSIVRSFRNDDVRFGVPIDISGFVDARLPGGRPVPVPATLQMVRSRAD